MRGTDGGRAVGGARINDPRVLAAMRNVPRHCSCPTTSARTPTRITAFHRPRPDHLAALYGGIMTQALGGRGDRVLEIGTVRVISRRSWETVVRGGDGRAQRDAGGDGAERLAELGYANVRVIVGTVARLAGVEPVRRVMVTAGSPRFPSAQGN